MRESAVTMAVSIAHLVAVSNLTMNPVVTLRFASVGDRLLFMTEIERQLKPLLHPAAHDLIQETKFEISGIKFVCVP